MGYTALYRKFRPIKFGELVGQEHITKTLKNQIMLERVGHAYLFNGGRGTGKTSAAKLLARVVNCQNPIDGEPCNECEICKASLDGSLTDIVEMDAASNNSVEDVREIREAVNFLPTKAKYRVYIIDEVHMLSSGAFNALLKTLEEPPGHVKFILATTEPQKIPATILSRCQRFDFKRISNDDIIKRLKIVCDESKIKISDEALNLIATLAEGGMRDALSILERCNQDGEDKVDEDKIRDLVGIPKITYIKQIVEAITDMNVSHTLEVVENILKEGKDLNNLLWEIIKYVKDILLYKSTLKTESYSKEEIEDIKAIADKVSKEDLINLICSLSEIENNMRMSTQKLIIFQTGLIKLCNKIPVTDDLNTASTNNSDLEARIAKLENFTQAGNFANLKNRAAAAISDDATSKVTVVSDNNTTSSVNKTNATSNTVKYEGEVQDYWPKLVNSFLAEGKRVMHMNLNGTIARQVNDMILEIEFPNGMNAMAKQYLEMPENKMNLKNIVHQAVGKEMQIKFVDKKPCQNENKLSGFEDFANNAGIQYNVTD